jgi:pilus assembly protein CpaF
LSDRQEGLDVSLIGVGSRRNGGRGETGAPDEARSQELLALARELREVVIDDRVAEARRREADGLPAMSPQDHLRLAERAIKGELRARYITASHSGATVLSNDEQATVRSIVLASVISRRPQLDELLARNDITDIFFNGATDARVRLLDGTEERIAPVFVDDDDMVRLVQDLARHGGNLATIEDPFGEGAGGGGALEHEFSAAKPTVDLRLSPSGARFTAMGRWVTVTGTNIAIRLHPLVDANQRDLVERGMYDPGLASFLAAAMRLGWGLFIAGQPGAGKTTLMRALAHELHPDTRIIQIEQNPELGLQLSPKHNQVLAWVERPPNMEGRGAVTLADHARNAQRANPDRVFIGEVRGAEVMALLDALSLGVPGMCTMHATSATNVLSRLILYAQRGDASLTDDHVLRAATEGLDLIVHLDETSDGRRAIREVLHIDEFDETTKRPITNQWFVPDGTGRAYKNPHAPIPQLLLEQLRAHGYDPGLHPHAGAGGAW